MSEAFHLIFPQKKAIFVIFQEVLLQLAGVSTGWSEVQRSAIPVQNSWYIFLFDSSWEENLSPRQSKCNASVSLEVNRLLDPVCRVLRYSFICMKFLPVRASIPLANIWEFRYFNDQFVMAIFRFLHNSSSNGNSHHFCFYWMFSKLLTEQTTPDWAEVSHTKDILLQPSLYI